MADGTNKPNRPIRPRGGTAGRKRRVVIEGGAARGRDARASRERPAGSQPRPQQPTQPTGPATVESGVTIQNLSQALGVGANQIIAFLMGLGQGKMITQSLSDDEVELIAAEFGREVTIKHAADDDEEPEAFEDAEADLMPRPPVVTIMGHVDHGKTTLLDAIREASVVETEAGGITQHIGAYQADVDGRKVTFLDTPGHEAFTAMRARGAKVTDIAVLVVAADDGVMPQTRESISHARAAGVPIVVAVNKIDLPDANTDRVKSELAAEGLQPEDWGGATQFAEVSAKQKQNLDGLLEQILLVADAELELTANPKTDASGPIIESRLDVGRGPVATMLVQRGTLRIGDAIVAGDASGKVRALYDYRGEKVKEARPGEPVEILGFDRPPPAGELARVVEHERQAKDLANKRAERLRREQLAQRSKRGVSLETLFTQMQEGAVQDLNIVLKGDVQGSVEALLGELNKIQHPEVRVNVIHTGVGGITENDVNLASASDALVVGFNVRPSAEARALAEREGVDIRTYRVIYQLTEDIQQALVGMLSPIEKEETLG
jgi:translation initiation factor IF-2